MTPLPIGAAGPDALPHLAALHAAAFDAPWSAEALAELLASPFNFALQAGSPPAGFILARTVAGEAEILTLAVDPVSRRSGIGRALVDAAVGTALAMGAQTLWLEVADDNAAARALYASAGFEPAGRRRAYYSRAQGAADALVLKRRLNSAPA